jgi:hypothetical protein
VPKDALDRVDVVGGDGGADPAADVDLECERLVGPVRVDRYFASIVIPAPDAPPSDG